LKPVKHEPKFLVKITMEDHIELSKLGEDSEGPSSPHQNGINLGHYDHQGNDSDDDDSDLGDEGSRALLGSHERKPGRELIPGHFGNLWPQIKGIVIEVSGDVDEKLVLER